MLEWGYSKAQLINRRKGLSSKSESEKLNRILNFQMSEADLNAGMEYCLTTANTIM